MTRIALTPYALEVHTNGSAADGGPTPLEGREALEAVALVLDRLGAAGARVDRRHARVLRLERLERTAADHLLWGVLEGGSFGAATDLYDVGTGKASHRSATQAELLPFYLAIDFAARPALVLLERVGGLGIKMQLDETLRAGLARRDPPLGLRFTPWPTADAARRYLHAGELRAIRFERARAPSGWLPALGRDAGKLEVRVALRGPTSVAVRRSLERLMDVGRPGTVADVLAATGAGSGTLARIGFDGVKLEVAYAGSTRVVDVTAPDAFDVDIPLDGEIEIGEGGHPTVASLHRAALRHLAGLRAG